MILPRRPQTRSQLFGLGLRAWLRVYVRYWEPTPKPQQTAEAKKSQNLKFEPLEPNTFMPKIHLFELRVSRGLRSRSGTPYLDLQ